MGRKRIHSPFVYLSIRGVINTGRGSIVGLLHCRLATAARLGRFEYKFGSSVRWLIPAHWDSAQGGMMGVSGA